MNILVANDDGVFRRGIKELTEALAGIEGAHIYVCGPDRERTCASHGLTMFEPMHVEEYDKADFPKAEMVWVCSGTPADCTRLGLAKMAELGIKADLVCTGINHGSNIGQDVHYSGTVSAAMEAMFKGVPAIAFSLCNLNCTHFEHFRTLVPQIVNMCCGKVPSDVLINVNVPDLPKEEIKGIKITQVGPRDYNDMFVLVNGDRKSGDYVCESEEIFPEVMDPSWDVTAWKDGWITITPVQKMSTNQKMFGWLNEQHLVLV